MLLKTKGIIFIISSLAVLLGATFVFNSIDIWKEDVPADQYINIGEETKFRKKPDGGDKGKDDTITGDFKASGKSDVKVGANVRDNKLLNEKEIFKVTSGKTADVHVYAIITEKGLKKICFHFVDSYGVEQRSGEFSIPKDARDFIVWSSFKFKRGSWKVTVKDVASHAKLATKRFVVKSDLVRKIRDANLAGKSKTYVKVGSHASGSYIKEANIIAANRWGHGMVYCAAWIIQKKATRIYFYFEEESGKNRHSAFYRVGVNEKGYRIWISHNLPKGKWKVQVKDASHAVLAEKSFIIR